MSCLEIFQQLVSTANATIGDGNGERTLIACHSCRDGPLTGQRMITMEEEGGERCPRCQHDCGECVQSGGGDCVYFWSKMMWACWCCGEVENSHMLERCAVCKYPAANGGCRVRRIWTIRRVHMEALLGPDAMAYVDRLDVEWMEAEVFAFVRGRFA